MRLEPRAAVAAGAAHRGPASRPSRWPRCSRALLVAWAGAPRARGLRACSSQGALGSRFALTETLTRATPLILTGLAAAVAFRARLWNIGAEGQLYAGALAAVAVGQRRRSTCRHRVAAAGRAARRCRSPARCCCWARRC